MRPAIDTCGLRRSRRGAAFALLCALQAFAAAPLARAEEHATHDDEEGAPRFSLATESDRAAWGKSGFRLGLGVAFGDLYGLLGAPSGRLVGAQVRVGLQLDSQWSLQATFAYAGMASRGGLSGMRFAGTLEPTLHLSTSWSVAVGLGYGGIIEGSTGRPDPAPLASTLETSYTFPRTSPPLPSCTGLGAAASVRVQWAYVLGPRSQTNLALEGIGQWTGCVDESDRVEPDSGKAIVRRQWWPHLGVALAWGFAWR